MTANINSETGIAFGYISANALDPDTVHELLYGPGADNLTYKLALAEWLTEQRRAHAEAPVVPNTGFDEEWATDYFNERVYSGGDEEDIEGTYEGVHYLTSYLGGALNFFILESPHIGGCQPCSPCVPNAGDLGSRGAYVAYDVPSHWLTEWVK